MNPEIRLMNANDISFALSLTDGEHWGYLSEDFMRLLAVEPEGCFVATDNGQPAGMITTTSYEDYAFIGSLIVVPDRRGRGIGEALLRRALDYLFGLHIRSIELDGTFAAVSLYHRLGFKDKYLSLRFVRPGTGSARVDRKTQKQIEIEQLTETILQLDHMLTGLNRTRLLTRFAAESPASIYIHPPQSPSGYARVYPRAGDYSAVGPLVARDDATAAHIWDSILNSRTSGSLAVGIPEPHRSAVRMVTQRGFLYRAPSLRMYLGEKRSYESSIYAIASAEKG